MNVDKDGSMSLHDYRLMREVKKVGENGTQIKSDYELVKSKRVCFMKDKTALIRYIELKL